MMRTLCLVLLLLIAPHVFARQMALLVGVAAYPALPARLQLDGPQNDVELVRGLLVRNGFAAADVHALANKSVNADAAPTRANVLAGLERLATDAHPGDFVYVQFSGHGAQQPSRPGKFPAEPDGLDELFLPEDAGRWDGSVGAVKNAIRDDEIGAKLDAIRVRGAFVWAVFDTCHAGSMARGIEQNETRERRIPARELGIPASLLARASHARGAAQGAISAATLQSGGSHVYFYAAQTNEAAPESAFPPGAPGRKPYGAFTFMLAQVIESHPGISYRQAGERVLQLYAAGNLQTTPMFEGSGLDAPLFGHAPGVALRQWNVAQSEVGRYRIEAGALQLVGRGAVFGVYADAAAGIDVEPLGYLRAEQVEAAHSELSPTSWRGRPVLHALPPAAVARLVQPGLAFNLRIAPPAQVPAAARYRTAQAVLEHLRQHGVPGIRLTWVRSNESADVSLAYASAPDGKARLWLLPADGAWVRAGREATPSIALDGPYAREPVLRGELERMLQRCARAINLKRLAAMGAGEAGKLQSRLTVLHAASKSGAHEEIDPANLPELRKGDRLELVLRNNGVQPLDVTVFGIDARYGISLLYPATAGDANRILPRDELRIPGAGQGEIRLDGGSHGKESLLVVAVEAAPESPQVNLGFLAQPALLSKGDGGGDLAELFDLAGADGYTPRGDALRKTAFRLYQYRAR